MKNSTTTRLLSLDVLRGITIAGMLLVNNPGSWSYVYAPLRHAAWDGLTPTDLVFPFFIFIMGVSMFISYRKYDFELNRATFNKLLRRSLLLFVIGVLLNWFGLFCRTLSSLRMEDISFWAKLYEASIGGLDKLRFLGVLQRLALVSFFGSLILLWLKPKRLPWFIGIVLVCYSLLMWLTDSLALTDTNIAARIDVFLLGASHMYKMGGIPFDPEGLLSTIPCLAQVSLGVMAGSYLVGDSSLTEKMNKLFIMGTILFFSGALLSYGIPVNKTLWSATYVLETCGLASLLLAILIYIIDFKGKKRWTIFFETFGVNPLFLFILGGVLSNLISNIGYSVDGVFGSLKGRFYADVLSPLFGSYLGSCIFALLFIGFCWSVGYYLYKKKIYIKL